MGRMSDIDIDTRAILEAEAEQLDLDIGDKEVYINNNYTHVATKIDSITCLQQLKSLGMEEAYCEPEGYKDPDWQPRVLQGGLL